MHVIKSSTNLSLFRNRLHNEQQRPRGENLPWQKSTLHLRGRPEPLPTGNT